MKGLKEIPADAHDLADGFHLESKLVLRANELGKVPARHFHDHIVKRRLKIGTGCLRDLVFQFIKGVADGQFGSDLRDRVSGCLARKCGRPAHARVDLDHDQLLGLRVNGKLDVAPAGKIAHGAHQEDRLVPHFLVLGI